VLLTIVTSSTKETSEQAALRRKTKVPTPASNRFT
jgi:hypothetical protein